MSFIHRTSDGRAWRDTPHPGVQISGLRRNDEGGGAFLARIAKGARVPPHDHPGGEEVFVVSGRARVGGVTLVASDYLWTAPGDAHDLYAEEDTVIFVTTPKGVRMLE